MPLRIWVIGSEDFVGAVGERRSARRRAAAGWRGRVPAGAPACWRGGRGCAGRPAAAVRGRAAGADRLDDREDVVAGDPAAAAGARRSAPALRSCSRRRRRTAGVIRASGSPVGGAAVAARPRRGRAARRPPAPGRPALRAGPLARRRAAGRRLPARRRRGSRRRRRSAARTAGAAAARRGAGDAVRPARRAPASSAVSMTAISALLGTVAPSSARISRRMPSNGDGTSALTLSVMTSSSGSYLSTWSPGCFSHLPIVPSATLSPSWGIVTLATFAAPSGPGSRLVAA